MEIAIEKIKDGIDKAAMYTVRKTGEIASLAKLQLKKTELRAKIDGVYKKIGRLIYESKKEHNSEEEINEELSGLIVLADEYNEALQACITEIESYKEK